jgi:hypothetical protein
MGCHCCANIPRNGSASLMIYIHRPNATYVSLGIYPIHACQSNVIAMLFIIIHYTRLFPPLDDFELLDTFDTLEFLELLFQDREGSGFDVSSMSSGMITRAPG